MWTWKKLEDRAKLAQRYFSSVPGVRDRTEDIRKAIIENGKYSEYVEWRISTITVLTVEPVEVKGKRWYRVSAECGHELVCHAPTIERAAQFLRTYEQLIDDMFYSLGWPSWASKTQLHPEDGAP